MQSSNKKKSTRQSFDILLFDQFSNHCLANTIEPLRAANTLARQSLYDWRFLTMTGDPVASSSGMQVAPHGALMDASAETLMVMPSYGYRAWDRWDTIRGLKGAAKRYDTLAGLDTGSWLLASAGLLDGYRATIHWEELTGFAEAFPLVDSLRERFVIDRDRITCSGAMAAFDLIMHLIGEGNGQLLAMEVAQLFMTRDSARSHRSQASTSSKLVDRALSVMQGNLESPLAIGRIAQQAGCTQKSLETRMKQELKATPQAVYRRLRLNLARKLVCETDQPISEIASRCGYDNASAMTRAFKTEFDQTPRMLRNPG